VQVMAEWVQKLEPVDDPETKALLELLATREQVQKLLAAEAVKVFDIRQWRKWSRELPRKAARIRRGSIAFKHLALERWTEAYELHRRAMRSRSQISFHQLRIGIKRFRYIVENFLPQQHEAWSADLKELQDLLGDVHDLDVLWTTASEVNAFESQESRAKWHAIILEAREKRLTRYRERMIGSGSLWRVWRAELPEGDQIRNASVARLRLWASFLDPDFKHSERVAALATQLFEGLNQLRLTPTSPEHDLRSILLAAALTHDVGRAKGEKGHHKTSFRLIRRMNPPLGWTVPDVQLSAAIARFHRGTLPQPHHKSLQHMNPEDKKLAIYLAGVLRLANAFDGNRDGQLRALQVDEKEGALVISVGAYAAWTQAAEEIAAARHLLELVLRRPVLIKPLKTARRRRSKSRVALPPRAA
jgi:HD superfamily phosphodiesterase